MVYGPLILAIAMLIASIFSGWEGHPHAERVEFRTGYGVVENDKNQKTHFQLTPLFPSVVIPLTRPIGPSWARGRIEWNPELFIVILSNPYVRPMLGMDPIQFRYQLEPIGRWSPYVLGTAGILYANVHRQETNSDLNFNIGIGVGTRYAVTDKTWLLLEYRHVHISNAGIKNQNSGIDSDNFLAGISRKL